MTLKKNTDVEDFVARLTDAAYRVSLKHRDGNFLDLQLELWSAVRGEVVSHLDARPLSAVVPVLPEVVFLT